MAEVQAGQVDAQQQQQQQQQQQDQPDEKKVQPAPRTYSQEELDRIANKIRKNARREARLEAERDFYARQAAAPKPEEKKEAPKEDAEPKREDFDDYETFQRAVAKHEARQVAREETKKDAEERERKARETAQQESAQKAQKTWQGKIEKAMAKHADFEDVLEDNGETLEVIGGAPMREFITESDIGPEIVFHLCQHPEEAKRIAALPKYKQAAEIAKIEDTLAAAAKPKDEKKGEDDQDDETPEEKEARERGGDGRFKPKKDPSKAPEPIEPVGARSANASSLPSDKDDAETWRRKELARLERLKRPGGK